MIHPKWLPVLATLGVGLILKFGSPLVWLCGLVASFRDPACFVPYMMGNVVYIGGCFLAARAKGRSWAWGLSGFLCVLALPILYLLQDRSLAKAA